MVDSIRETIILDALEQLALITIANGYQYDMSEPGRAIKNIDTNSYPLSIVFPQPEENLKQTGGRDTLQFQLRVESHMLLGTANPSVLQEKMLADLRKNLSNPADVWSTLFDSIIYAEGGPADQPSAEDKTTAVYSLFTVVYRTLTGDPYTQ